MADTPQVDTQQQLPPPNVAGLATLFPSQPQAAATLGPSAPVQQPASPDIMQEMVEASRQGRQAFGVESGKARDIGGQVQSLIQQQQQTPLPKTSWLDTQGQPQQGGFLHSLGRALIAIGGATGPGREIQAQQYGPGIRRYAAETGARARQITELQGEEKEAGQRATAAGGLVSKPITAAGSAMRGEAAITSAAARTQAVINQHADKLAQIAAMKDMAAKRNATQIEVTQMRDEMMREVTQMKDVTAEDVASIMTNSAQTIINTKFANDPSMWGDIKSWFGVGAAMAPGGQAPVRGAAPLPPAQPKTKPAAGSKPAYQKNGIWYDATTNKPLGKP